MDDYASSLSAIRGSTSCPSTSDSIKISITPKKKLKEFKHVIETILCCDPEVEKDLTFMNLFREATSKNIID